MAWHGMARQLPPPPLQQLARGRPAAPTRPPPLTISAATTTTTAPLLLQVHVPGEAVMLGKDLAYPSFGWDNEYGAKEVDVAAFRCGRGLGFRAALSRGLGHSVGRSSAGPRRWLWQQSGAGLFVRQAGWVGGGWVAGVAWLGAKCSAPAV